LKIVVITQQIELNGVAGRMIAALLLGLTEIELEYRQERQPAGIEVAKRKGIYKGRRKGTTKAEPSRPKQLRAKGLAVAEIATASGTNNRMVQRYLKASPATASLLQTWNFGKLDGKKSGLWYGWGFPLRPRVTLSLWESKTLWKSAMLAGVVVLPNRSTERANR
jgi:hypothetical protein